MIRFFVPGVPAPGGSKNPIPIPDPKGPYIRVRDMRRVRIVMADAGGKANKAWKRAVAVAARKAYTGEPVDFPLVTAFEFVVARPKSHYRTGKFAGQLKPDAPELPAVSPDVLKLARSTEDALNGIVWVDDSRNVTERMGKRYARMGEGTGCWVEVAGVFARDDAQLRGSGSDDAE